VNTPDKHRSIKLTVTKSEVKTPDFPYYTTTKLRFAFASPIIRSVTPSTANSRHDVKSKA
jgi:hypothetical protein